MEAAVAHWDGSPGVRQRIEAIAGATAAVTVLLEHIAFGLEDWMESQVDGDEPAAEAGASADSDEEGVRLGAGLSRSAANVRR